MIFTKKIKTLTLGVLATASLLVGTTAFAPSVSAAETGSGSSCRAPTILTLPVWYRGVVDDGCNVNISSPTDIWKIVLNVLEMLMQLAGYLAAIFIMWGGFKYITSQGSPDTVSKASSTIMNASIGLIIAIAASAIVRFIAERIGG